MKTRKENFLSQFWTLLATWMLAGFVGLACAETAEACSSCFSATAKAGEAYYVVTALMLGVLFLVLAAIGVWLYLSSAKQKTHVQAEALPAVRISSEDKSNSADQGKS